MGTTASKKVKPGVKTSEFWLSFAAEFVGLLLASGMLIPGSTTAKVVGVAAMAFTALGYGVSRGIAKK